MLPVVKECVVVIIIYYYYIIINFFYLLLLLLFVIFFVIFFLCFFCFVLVAGSNVFFHVWDINSPQHFFSTIADSDSNAVHFSTSRIV